MVGGHPIDEGLVKILPADLGAGRHAPVVHATGSSWCAAGASAATLAGADQNRGGCQQRGQECLPHSSCSPPISGISQTEIGDHACINLNGCVAPRVAATTSQPSSQTS